MTYSNGYGTAGSGGYGNDFSGQPGSAASYEAQQREKRQIRKLGRISGLGLVLFVVFQFIASGVLVMLNLYDDYLNSTDAGYAIGALVSIFCIFVPFLLVSFLLRERRQQCFNFGKPYDGKLMAYAVPIGIMACMIANYVSYYLSAIIESSTGVTFESPETPVPTTALGITAYLIQLAFVPAIVEEFALRGVVMMPARRFGNWFAILVSSAIFGLMHGNLVQAPFAFIVGIGIGYLVIVTGSMWTGVMIHFCNNLFSGLISIFYEFMAEKTVDTIYYCCVAAFFAFGILFTVLFVLRAKQKNITLKFKKPETALSRGSRTAAYFVNFPMILAIIFFLVTTYSYISW